MAEITATRMYDAVRDFTGAQNPSAFLAVNSGNLYFSLPDTEGAIAYRQTGKYLVQFGGPFAPTESYDALLTAFREFATEQGRSVVSIQLQQADAVRYVETGFTVNQVGASYAIELSRFSLAGTRFMRLRNKIARAHKAGLVVFEADYADWAEQMRALDAIWLRGKGEEVHQLEFLVGEYGGEMQGHRRLFIGTIDGELAGYISYSPVFGARAGWMHDLSRRIPGKLPGIMEAINKAAIDAFGDEGIAWLHFGFTPFTGLDADRELPGHSTAFSELTGLLWEYGEAVYPAKTQLAYKEKWAQHLVLPEYVAFDGPADVAAFVHVFRACGAL
ncbi:DUF2156 domain-containing protein [Jatrophihabitans lederbergiae]|uniref:DUF2156 domain-containing protein n=1 Tax=Jatrophihabitans lederbergiae TaxID=3075547 RepID=A0ABU2JBN4_9ACTN|nr:DUF2156 domain-containing protein [Jatrophihabitans sp. DSM 44399]MDT0262138.1 DUF2156 domain-containing protein [Jatrophihabitans sp. DSM 44399]